MIMMLVFVTYKYFQHMRNKKLPIFDQALVNVFVCLFKQRVLRT